MSGGIIAIKGFDYQATVILDELLSHFEQWGEAASVRPEGVDDLDLFVGIGSSRTIVHAQIKKPREDKDGARTPSPWKFSEAVDLLFPHAVRNLADASHTQRWILGDFIEPDLASLLDLGPHTPGNCYRDLVHLLARNESFGFKNIDQTARNRLLRWRFAQPCEHDVTESLRTMVEAFGVLALKEGVAASEVQAYRKAVAGLHAMLPSALGRIKVKASNGLESEVVERVQTRLRNRYGLNEQVVTDTLFRNLRGFINDVSKQQGREFGLAEFDYEITRVWPNMVPIKVPPRLGQDHVSRSDITDLLVDHRLGIVELVGVSGAGKTSVTTEAIERLHATNSRCIAFYLEVRSATPLRDVLAGVAFSLRRYGLVHAFGIAVDGYISSERAADDIVRLMPALDRPVSLFLDLVDGKCDDGFARELCNFARKLSVVGTQLRLVVLGQERALRNLSDLDREELGVVHADVRGFNYRELQQLVRLRNPEYDLELLRAIFERVTRRQSTGLTALRARTIVDMTPERAKMAAQTLTPEELFVAADHDRFMRISQGALNAASKLLCFALPFSRMDAAQIFHSDNVGLAIREMLNLGLLREYDEAMFEMHETVRAGLEQGCALKLKLEAHAALADWYRDRGDVPERIFHLERAGKVSESRQCARAAFLSGTHRPALLNYVIEHRLISAREAGQLLLSATDGTQAYVFTEIFRNSPDPAVAEDLMAELARDPKRFEVHFSWAPSVIRAILLNDFRRLHSLFEFALAVPVIENHEDLRVRWLEMSVDRAGPLIDEYAIDFFRAQSDEGKARLLGVMLRIGRREPLREAFGFMARIDRGGGNGARRGGVGRWVQVRDMTSAIDFLAALPSRQVAEMVAAKSVLLDPFLSMIWAQKNALRRCCVKLLERGEAEPVVIQNAARVLLSLGESRLLALTDPARQTDTLTRTVFSFLPVLLPWHADLDEYERRLLDTRVEPKMRLPLVAVLASRDIDLGHLLEKLSVVDAQHTGWWNWTVLALGQRYPFAKGIPLVAHELDINPANPMLSGLVRAFATLEDRGVPELLKRALSHNNAMVRIAAANGLANGRYEQLLPDLVDRLAVEDNSGVAQSLVAAIAASYPDTTARTKIDWSRVPQARVWRLVLAGRLRDDSESDELVDAATDTTQHWQVRRAAIAAAGRLDYAKALVRIQTKLRAERSPFSVDRTRDLIGHETLVDFLQNGLAQCFPRLPEQRDEFISQVAKDFSDRCTPHILVGELPSGLEVAAWVFDELLARGYPVDPQAPDKLLHGLMVPLLQAAALRSMRLCGRFDLLEREVKDAYSVWYSMRCLLQLRFNWRNDPDLGGRLLAVVTAPRWSEHPILASVVRESFGMGDPAPLPADAGSHAEPPAVSARFQNADHGRVVAWLADAKQPVDLSLPFVLDLATQDAFEDLVHHLHPANDYIQSATGCSPQLTFTDTGYFVHDSHGMGASNRADLRSSLRPALVAANRWGIGIPWHTQLLEDDVYDRYAQSVVDCLVARGDANLFYEELGSHEMQLAPCIFKSQVPAAKVKSFADVRLLPVLMRHLGAGADSFLDGLCTVVGFIDLPEVDPVLDGLLERWLGRFEPQQSQPQHLNNPDLWRAFNRLSAHPRFGQIRNWDLRLHSVLSVRTYESFIAILMRVLERSPRSYRVMEERLLCRYEARPMLYDELDVLDTAADRLFRQPVRR